MTKNAVIIRGKGCEGSTSCNSHFLKMCYLASLGFDTVPGALGTIIDGVFVAHAEYWFEPGIGVHLKRTLDGAERFIPFHDLFPATSTA